MGTNYYLYTDFCPCCGKPRKKIHLGKSSMDCKFLIHKTEKIFDYNSFCNFIETGIIKDEYERECSAQDLKDLITAAQQYRSHLDCEHIYGYDFLSCDFC